MGHNNLVGFVPAILLTAVIVALAVFVIGAVVSVLRSSLAGGMKFVWIVLVFLAPFIGSLLWYVIGRPNARSARYRV